MANVAYRCLHPSLFEFQQLSADGDKDEHVRTLIYELTTRRIFYFVCDVEWDKIRTDMPRFITSRSQRESSPIAQTTT
jgi:hypothetical protein